MSERSAFGHALAAVLLWSTVATGFELGLERLRPAQLLFAGALVSTLVFWAAVLATGAAWRVSRRAIAAAAIFGLVNPFAYYLVLFGAYDRLPAQVAQPLNYTWAIALALLAWPVLGQRPTRRVLVGLGVSYAGVVVVISQGRFDAWAGVDWAGVALALASTVLWAGYWLAAARIALAPLVLMALSFSFATPLIGLACVLGPGLPAADAHTLAFGAWVGLVEMGVSFVLWQRALRLTAQAGRLGQLIFVSPFLSLLMIGAVLDERVHATSWIGLAVIVAGLAITHARAPAAPRG